MDILTHLFIRQQVSQLVAVWPRGESRLGELLDEKVPVYKQLRWLWDDPLVQASACSPKDVSNPGTEQPDPESCVWDQTNTVPLDDSLEKADSEPCNLLQVEEFTGNAGSSQDNVLGAVLAYIEDPAWEPNISSSIHYRPFECARSQGWNWTIGCLDFDSEQERNVVARNTK